MGGAGTAGPSRFARGFSATLRVLNIAALRREPTPFPAAQILSVWSLGNPTHTATHAGEKEGRGSALESFLTC